ncbi:MAG: T9SS type A sorting domain-containing protein [Bacteroidetes bacterium]|nr:T9SS type A sorting domain-containing protein [Bacteroidota bacterium]
MVKILIAAGIALSGVFCAYAQHSDTLYPAEDVYVKTYGGGEGKNSFIKFDITSIPPNSVVIDVRLEVFVLEKALNWDGDIKFMNVNNQTWMEGDTETTLWNYIKTDTVFQLLNFGTAPGWTASENLKNIFLKDYNAANNFCSIMMKDPDDPTGFPGGSNPAYDSNDSLMAGNIFNDFIIFAPREFSVQSQAPRLIVNYVIAPSLTSQPGNLIRCEAESAIFTITATGDAPLAYQWQKDGTDVPGATADSMVIAPVSLSSAGNYLCVVTNAGGTDTSSVAVLTVNPLPVVNLGTDTNQCGGNVVLDAGNGGSTFLWSDSSTNQTLTVSSSGIYSVEVTDSNGCSNNDTMGVTINTVATLTMNSTDATCGNNNGSASVTAGGGTPPYSYLWSAGATTDTINGVPPGAYSVTVTDFNGCAIADSAFVIAPVNLAISGIVTNASTVGNNDGYVDITVTGGTPSYSFNWSNGYMVEDIYSLTAGTYTVTITDGNNCTLTDTFTVSEPLCSLTAVISSWRNPSCNGYNDGEATVSASNGVIPYSFQWSNGQTDSIASSLYANTYTVTVTDTLGCSAVDQVTITEPTWPFASITVTPITCYGGSDGSGDLTVTGGTPPYSYLWSTGDSSEDIDSLSAGWYDVQVIDSLGCSQAWTSADLPDPPQISVTGMTAPSSGSNGSVDISVSDGTSPYSFLWSNSATGEDISGLSAGQYTVTVTDVNGCTNEESFIVNDSIACFDFMVSLSSSDITCYGNNDGNAYAAVTGGTPPYVYSWSNSMNTDSITGLPAGTYYVTVTDSSNCYFDSSVNITEPPELATSITGYDVVCYGNNDGSADLTISGGTGPFTIAWYDTWPPTIPIATTEDLSGLAPGDYGVNVADANGCTTPPFPVQNITYVIINDANPLSASTNVVCVNSGNDGAASVTLMNGSLPYTYLWSTGATTDTITGLSPGIYLVTVSDSCGSTFNFSFTVNSCTCNLSAYLNFYNVSCYGGNDGSIEVITDMGTAPFTYSWSNGETSELSSGLTAGIYSFTVTDSSGCIYYDAFTLMQPDSLTATINATNISCNGDATGIADLLPMGSTGSYSIYWSTGDVSEDLVNIPAGTYSVTVTDVSCNDSAFASVVITEPTVLDMLQASFDVSCYGLCDGFIVISPYGGIPPYAVVWNNSATDTLIMGLCPGSYSVTATDANGCTDSASFTINEPALLTAAATSAPAYCFGNCDGTITVVANGGTPPYSGDGTTAGYCAGNYAVTLTDANGCVASDSVIISEPIPVNLVTNSIDVTCYGTCNGSVAASVSGPPPIIYLWNTGASAFLIDSLCPGAYYVTVTDAGGCTATDSAQITEPTVLTLALDSISATFPNGCADGQAIASPSGGTGAYTYIWNDLFSQTTATATGLFVGLYSVTVTDANGCTITGSVNIDCAMGSGELSETGTGIQVYPNPANDKISIEFSGLPGGISFAIFDMMGRNIETPNLGVSKTFHESGKIFEINVKGWDEGIYYLKIDDGASGKYTKLVICR